MKLFIDTAEVDQVREAWSWGIIDGVTTNPSHVAKSGRQPSEVYREICDLMSFDILQQLYHHPLTDVVLDQFLKDWATIPVK